MTDRRIEDLTEDELLDLLTELQDATERAEAILLARRRSARVRAAGGVEAAQGARANP